MANVEEGITFDLEKNAQVNQLTSSYDPKLRLKTGFRQAHIPHPPRYLRALSPSALAGGGGSALAGEGGGVGTRETNDFHAPILGQVFFQIILTK
jgi:hypothetical protein